MIDKIYKCNLCGIKKEKEELIELIERESGSGWKAANSCCVEDTKTHLCFACISSIQSLPLICVAGFMCKGGITCSSDHK